MIIWNGDEWYLENGYYVNHSTGECEKQSRFEEAVKFLTTSSAVIPSDEIVKKAVDKVVPLSSAEIKSNGRGRKPKFISNPYCLSLRGYKKFSDLPQWLDDVLYGSGNAHEHGCRVPVKLVYCLLRDLPFISSAVIKTYINSKRDITTGDIVNDRYCRYIVATLESAMKSIEYHLERGKDFYTPEYDDFDFEQDAVNYLSHVQSTQTIERKIELMLAAGLTVEEINKRSDVIEANAQLVVEEQHEPKEDKSMSLTYEEFKELADRYQRERQERIAAKLRHITKREQENK